MGPRNGICPYVYKNDIAFCVIRAKKPLSGSNDYCNSDRSLAVLAFGLLYPFITNISTFGQGAIQFSVKLVGSDFMWVNTANGETQSYSKVKGEHPSDHPSSKPNTSPSSISHRFQRQTSSNKRGYSTW